MEIILKEKRVKRWGKKAFRYIAPIKDPKEGGGWLATQSMPLDPPCISISKPANNTKVDFITHLKGIERPK